ncbi:hypothetical protein FEM48_Zijuj01G0165500 [Ziziphus jujuba var. spinosa]|uniref:Uncharacterized protein n=1 Tax=Ziziphus jujuba var. spinosa TaxID=714518 RepID=A0A978W2C3_ZIZJJ|nr:hypothetical protein FEM48_Zijuj01G0165500 [Ziziphus jujuba var. spinosa]
MRSTCDSRRGENSRVERIIRWQVLDGVLNSRGNSVVKESLCTVTPGVEEIQAYKGRIDEVVGNKESTSSSESDDTDSSSDAYADINELLSKYQKTGENKRWAPGVAMVSAFEKDLELCLNAFCALH